MWYPKTHKDFRKIDEIHKESKYAFYCPDCGRPLYHLRVYQKDLERYKKNDGVFVYPLMFVCQFCKYGREFGEESFQTDIELSETPPDISR